MKIKHFWNWNATLLVGIILLYLGITCYQLQALPAEWYGDISIEHRFVLSILAGNWPWKFDLSAGPVYHYIVAAFAYFLGPAYLTYKIASVVTGLAALILIYCLGNELAGNQVGLLAAFTAAISFWLILFARLGSSPQILSPVLSAGAVYFLLRYQRTHRLWTAAASMFFASWGLFNYPATFILPPILLGLVLWQMIFNRPRTVWVKALLVQLAVLLPFGLVFGVLTVSNPNFAPSGYIGAKVVGQGEPLQAAALTFATNMFKTLAMFHWVGDSAFRTNIPGKPTLDPLSGLLMMLGLIWLFVDQPLRKRWAFVLLPLVALLVPSAAPGIPPAEIPSSSRAFGAAPFVFLLAGLGVDAIWAAACQWHWNDLPFMRAASNSGQIPVTGSPEPRKRPKPVTAVISNLPALSLPTVILMLLLVAMSVLNLNSYFGTYAWELPQHNQPWGQMIAQYIGSLPAGTQVKLASCCWEDREQPSPEALFYNLKNQTGREELLSRRYPYPRTCSDFKSGQTYVVIFPPVETSPLATELTQCFPGAQGELHYDAFEQPAFYSLFINPSAVLSSTP